MVGKERGQETNTPIRQEDSLSADFLGIKRMGKRRERGREREREREKNVASEK